MSADATPNAKEAYDAFAASYDDFNHRYMYERWTGKLLALAQAAGLQGKRLLDVGCGTGLSFVALLDRGFEVTGCDISPGMLDEARERVGDRATLAEADMRDLPTFGEFDLVWAVNDSVNYLLSADELQAALAGMRRNLTPGGVVLFDVNTLTSYRSFFAEETVIERGGRSFVWRGLAATADSPPGSIFEASFDGEGDGVTSHIHRQRHFPEAEVLEAIDAAGLTCVEVAGELEGELDEGVDEALHTKAVYVCRAADYARPFSE
jgi:SAM-dependent methyltransferase